ncbi:hypothetical protein GCM10020000_01810 [Streptomyces olivoverticillatus]
MPSLIRSADLMLCTPVYEPFGIVPLEAMACGVPVIATDVGGHRDTVAHGETGLLVPPGRPEPLAAAVRELLASPRTREHFGQAGRIRAVACYTWDGVANGVERVYAHVTTGARIPSEAR